MDKIQKIKQEIERIKKEVYNHNFAIDYSANGALDRVVRFIDSLPEKSGCEIDFTAKDEDLEEAAKHYLYGAILYDDVYVGNPTEEDCIRCFKAGAEWQKQIDFPAKDITDSTMYWCGYRDCKEEMMKDAVEGVIDIRKWPAKAQVEFYDRLPVFNVRTGDKVKIIIVKEG